ncbi:MAG: carbon-nitrogen hydrolase family protein [Hyphomicrobiales bacterium]|nr:carbon-nitrogen hydrolase family protein [Hyphomicrobiales bacterium]
MRALTIAAAQYPIDWLESFSAFEAKLSRWVEDGVRQGAELLVFPEYAGLELASLSGREAAGDLKRSIAAVSTHLPQADAAHAHLAHRHGVSILAGSAPERNADGSVRNVARLFTPDGACGRQEKMMMTRFEREQWGVSGGSELSVFDIGPARIGIAICYDVEFPLIARALAKAGAEVILAPSCTDTVHGYWRVRVGAQARALENQCVVVQAPLVGAVDWSPAVDINRGAAGVFGPPDLGFPEDGVIAQGEMDEPCFVTARLDLDAVARVRAEGQVFNHRHWDEQKGVASAIRVDLAAPAREVVIPLTPIRPNSRPTSPLDGEASGKKRLRNSSLKSSDRRS